MQVALKALKKALSIAKEAQEKDDYEGATFPSDPGQISLASLDQAYRVGFKQASWTSRNILVSFKDSYHRYLLLKTKSFLAEDDSVNFYLDEDMTPFTRAHKTKLRRVITAAKELNMEARMAGNKAIIEGTSYGINDLDTIPSKIAEKIKEEKSVKGGIAYRGKDSIFSNFYMSLSNITDRSSHRQSSYNQQLKDRDRDFLNMGNAHKVSAGNSSDMDYTTSTPKCSNSEGNKHLSDSELIAMGIDPNSDYATDVRLKYSQN